MTTGAVVWLLVAVVSAALFFAIAAVVTLFGSRDLRQLLAGSHQINDQGDGTSA